MNEQVILTIAEAVLANTRILQALVDSLPREAQERVERKVTEKKAKDSPAPAPVATVEISTPQVILPGGGLVTHAPAPTVAAPITPTTGTPPSTPMPAAQTAPAQPAPAAATPSNACPITDKSSLTKYVMDRYRALGAVRGGQIQGCLDAIGVKNINDIKPEQYHQFWTSVEALQ